MQKLSPIEIRVKQLVAAFLADEITRVEFKRKLWKEKTHLRPKKQRRLPKAGGRTFS